LRPTAPSADTRTTCPRSRKAKNWNPFPYPALDLTRLHEDLPAYPGTDR
jgi:hypothetical protein